MHLLNIWKLESFSVLKLIRNSKIFIFSEKRKFFKSKCTLAAYIQIRKIHELRLLLHFVTLHALTFARHEGLLYKIKQILLNA